MTLKKHVPCSFPFAFYAFSCDFHKMILVNKQDGYMIKEKKKASHFPSPICREGTARAKVFYVTVLPLQGDKKEEKRNRIIELQRNEMFEQKIISLTCSLQA